MDFDKVVRSVSISRTRGFVTDYYVRKDSSHVCLGMNHQTPPETELYLIRRILAWHALFAAGCFSNLVSALHILSYCGQEDVIQHQPKQKSEESSGAPGPHFLGYTRPQLRNLDLISFHWVIQGCVITHLRPRQILAELSSAIARSGRAEVFLGGGVKQMYDPLFSMDVWLVSG